MLEDNSQVQSNKFLKMAKKSQENFLKVAEEKEEYFKYENVIVCIQTIENKEKGILLIDNLHIYRNFVSITRDYILNLKPFDNENYYISKNKRQFIYDCLNLMNQIRADSTDVETAKTNFKTIEELMMKIKDNNFV
jgi:hypothetical protein